MTEIARGHSWPELLVELRRIAPEIFDSEGRLLNLMESEWKEHGRGKPILSPVDGSLLGHLPMLDVESAHRAAEHAAKRAAEWARVGLDERRERVARCLDDLDRHRELLARLLAWEIGKPVKQGRVSAERCTSGVRWYLEHAERMCDGRTPLGLVSNIASWNYPLSVLVHAVLVQVLAGNGAIAKVPSEGGAHAVTLAFAMAERAGLPVSLVSGSGATLAGALVRSPEIACLFFVGGKAVGRDIAASLHDRSKRAILEMEGLNAYGIWRYSDWASLAAQVKKGFEYGKQRCTAYPRFVVERALVPRFLEMYLPLVASLRVGHPLLSIDGSEPQDLDFGPLVSANQVDELSTRIAEAEGKGAVRLSQGRLSPERFLPEQDTSAYMAPATLLEVPRSASLYHAEPFGPVDSIIVVDSPEQMIAEMNVSNGSLVASIMTDDVALGTALAREVRAFKVGVNTTRSRGDRDEHFGGLGMSWRGPFVGGELLVRALTSGEPGERLPGNYDGDVLMPEGARR